MAGLGGARAELVVLPRRQVEGIEGRGGLLATTIFATPGDKAQVLVPVPGSVTILLVLLQFGAAVVSAWLIWPVWAAVLVSLLATASLVTERLRWRWLLSTDHKK
ncbi:hypothetical protein ACWCRC_32100 [Streptomyces sp. NPDC001940]